MATQPAPGRDQRIDLSSDPSREALLEELRVLCHGPQERRASQRWPVELPLEGWLQLDGEPEPPIPVDLLDLSGSGVQVVLDSHAAVWPGRGGVLITQAHGGGCGRRRVQCHWQRPHPQQPLRQCLGLAFATPG